MSEEHKPNDPEREAERARREERRAHRVRIEGHGFGVSGVDIDGMHIGDFAKGFMKDFVSDAVGDSYSETITREFAFSQMPRLRVRNISGDTVVKAGEPGKITITATKRVSASSEDRAKRLLQNLEIRMEQAGDELRVEPHLYEQERGWVDLFRGKRFRVDFEILVPAECGVNAHTVSGDLGVTGVRGPLELQTVSGEVELTDAQGPLRLKSVSGDVTARRYVGHVEGNTVSGDITFDASRMRSTELHTVSGDIEMHGVLEAGREHRFKTISGDVELALADADLLVRFSTASGDLEAAGGHVTRLNKKEYEVALGDARGSAVVRTVSGDVTVRASVVEVPGEASTEEPRRAAWTPGPEAVATDVSSGDVERTEPMTAPSEEVRSVLERVAKGELNVDDAAAAIDAARRGR